MQLIDHRRAAPRSDSPDGIALGGLEKMKELEGDCVTVHVPVVLTEAGVCVGGAACASCTLHILKACVWRRTGP